MEEIVKFVTSIKMVFGVVGSFLIWLASYSLRKRKAKIESIQHNINSHELISQALESNNLKIAKMHKEILDITNQNHDLSRQLLGFKLALKDFEEKIENQKEQLRLKKSRTIELEEINIKLTQQLSKFKKEEE